MNHLMCRQWLQPHPNIISLSVPPQSSTLLLTILLWLIGCFLWLEVEH